MVVGHSNTIGGEQNADLLVAARLNSVGTELREKTLVGAGEEIHLNLYHFDDRRVRLRSGVEVIVEKFEYLP